MNQYPREAWRPVLEGSFPAFEQEWEHPARVWDLVEGLHPRLHHHIVSRGEERGSVLGRLGASDCHKITASKELKCH